MQELQERILALTNERNDYQTTTVATAERIREIENVKQVTIGMAGKDRSTQESFQGVESRYKELENEKSLINNQYENDKLDYQRRMKELEDERQDLLNKNRVKTSFRFNLIHFDLFQEHEESLIDLCHEKEELEHKVTDLEGVTREWAQKFVNTTDNQRLMQGNHANMMNNLKQQYKCKKHIDSIGLGLNILQIRF